MATINLGMVTAYAYAVEGGYTGTEAEFETLLANVATTLNEFENFSATANTLAEGASATASYSGGILTLGIPKGDTGATGTSISSVTLNADYTLTINFDDGTSTTTGSIRGATGATPNLTIGTVTTGEVGADAAATITGTTDDPVLNLTLPRGATGDVTNLADTFSSSTAYTAGEYVIYNDLLYVFTADHAAGAWTGSDVEQVTVGEELSSLKDDLSDIASGEKVEINATIAGSGYCVVASTGATTSDANSSYTDYIDISKYESLIYKSVGYSRTTADPSGFAFYDDDKVYVAGYKYPIGQSANGYLSELQIVTVPNNAKYVRFGVFTDTSTYGNFALYGVLPIIQNFIDIDRKFDDDVVLANSKSLEGSVTKESVIDFSFIGSVSSLGEYIPGNTGYKCTDYINLDNVTGIYRTGTTTMFALWGYAFYDENKSFLGKVDETTSYTIVTYNGKQVTWLDLSGYPNAKYIRINIVPSRPYTYYMVKNAPVYSYDIPHITVNGAELQKFYGKKIVNFGDSIFGNFRDTNDTTDKSISKMIADATGATVYNCGFGGCRMSYHSQYWRAFSMYALADAITTNTWTDQDAAIAASVSGMPSYFSETLALLKSIDFNDVDYITIGYGVNDYTGNVFIDARTGLTEQQYFKGALDYSIRTILAAFPHIRIAVISPSWIWIEDANEAYDYSSDDTDSVNSRGLYLYDYVDACKTVCEDMHVAYIDTYYTLGFNQYSYTAYFNVKGVDGAVASDGTHPKQAGRQLRADRIIGQLESLY